MRTLLGFIKNPEESAGFISYLIELSKDLGTNLNLLYVENPDDHVVGTPHLSGAAVVNLKHSLEARLEEGKKTLKDLTDKMRALHSGKVLVEISAAQGNEVNIANEMIDSGKVHMVILENRDSEGFWWQNSQASYMVRNLKCPVWVIPENSEYHSFKRIIYATDYHQEDIPTLQKLIDLVHQLSPEILALHITNSVDFDLRVKTAGFQKMLETKTAYNKIGAKALVEKKGSNLVQLINSYAAMNRADLIVVLKENKNFIDRIFNPSYTEKIMKEANSPVLVYHTPR